MTIERPWLLFLLACIPARIGLLLLAKFISSKYLPYLGYAALLPALGFIIIYLFDLRKSGLETGGKTIWWNDLRAIHGLLYLCFALYAIKGNTHAWYALLVDVIFGFGAFVYNYSVLERVNN